MTSISVVMGVYNGAATLAMTLDSILAQTERDFELVVVDDGSTDDTPAILAAYASRDARIR
ncbi:MAG: glycosyltransferase family 2 protein, partial [Thermoanaerobaculia bacterium]